MTGKYFIAPIPTLHPLPLSTDLAGIITFFVTSITFFSVVSKIKVSLLIFVPTSTTVPGSPSICTSPTEFTASLLESPTVATIFSRKIPCDVSANPIISLKLLNSIEIGAKLS